MTIDYLKSPIGLLEIRIEEDAIRSIGLVTSIQPKVRETSLSKRTKKQLTAYFKRDLRKFDLSINLDQGTEFYQSVWRELLQIPYGSTTTYLEISRRLGDPNLTRAVGLANGKNPIAIVVPCHRVIGSDRSLTGYAYGVEVKQKLLAIENPREYALNGSLF